MLAFLSLSLFFLLINSEAHEKCKARAAEEFLGSRKWISKHNRRDRVDHQGVMIHTTLSAPTCGKVKCRPGRDSGSSNSEKDGDLVNDKGYGPHHEHIFHKNEWHVDYHCEDNSAGSLSFPKLLLTMPRDRTTAPGMAGAVRGVRRTPQQIPIRPNGAGNYSKIIKRLGVNSGGVEPSPRRKHVQLLMARQTLSALQ